MNYYTVCPYCGYKLMKAGGGSTFEFNCPRCDVKMTIEITDNKVTIQKVLKAVRELAQDTKI